MSVPRLLVVTGASGAGKTATVQALDARAVPGVQCFHFDSIGVPTGQANALNLAVIDTSLLTVTEAARQLEEIVLRLIESDAPAT